MSTLCSCATCGNVVCDVLWLSPCTQQGPWPHPLGGSCDRGHETALNGVKVMRPFYTVLSVIVVWDWAEFIVVYDIIH